MTTPGWHRGLIHPWIRSLACAGAVSAFAGDLRAQCTPNLFSNVNGSSQITCPCFNSGEQAGSVFTLPPGDLPIEILKVRILWASTSGLAAPSVEEAIHIYAAGLPNPGTPIFSLEGPVLTDFATNVFDLEPLPGQIIVSSAPFSVTLEFANANAGNTSAPSVVHDGNGCQSGKNLVYASPPGMWFNACTLGVSGDWYFSVEYRSLGCGTPGRVPESTLTGTPLRLSRNSASGDLTLTWGASCSTTAGDYEIYEGELGTFYSHNLLTCTTGQAAVATVSPAAGDTYYIVVPTDTVREGSYGRRGDGSERPVGGVTCETTQAIGCP